MNWETLLIQVGIPSVILLAAGLFIARELWPFLRERIKAGDSKMDKILADAQEAREKYLESMRQRDAAMYQLSERLEARDAKFMEVLERRDNRILSTLDRVIAVLNSNGRHG